MKRCVLLVGAIALVVTSTAFAAEETWKGTISDSMCAAKHSADKHGDKAADHRTCVQKCVDKGGQYVFLREAYTTATGFLFGWSLFLVIQTGTIAAVAVAFAKFTGVLTGKVSATNHIVEPIIITNPFTIWGFAFSGYALSLSTEQLLAVVLILFLTLTNTRGLKTGIRPEVWHSRS